MAPAPVAAAKILTFNFDTVLASSLHTLCTPSHAGVKDTSNFSDPISRIVSQIVHTGRDIVCCRGEKHDEQYLAFSIHTAGVKMRKVSPRMKGSGRLKSMNVVGFGAAGVLLPLEPPLLLLLRSCSCHPLTSEDRKNRPFSTFKIVPKLDSSASVPPPLVSPSRSAGSQMSRECRSPPSSKVKAGQRDEEEKSRSEASLSTLSSIPQ